MKRTTKGALAAGTAAVLLMGGAGTIAYWSADGNIAGGTINAGHLELEVVDAGTWSLNGAEVEDIASVGVVPGDEIGFSGSYEILAKGQNLAAEVTVQGAEVTGQLASELNPSVTTSIGGGEVGSITEAHDGQTVDVTATFDFDFDEATNDSQRQTVNLSEAYITLTQTDATP